MKLYNSLSRKKETVDLAQPMGVYVCGVTPYDTTHLGHAFTFLTYDVLVRFLKFAGVKVTYVQNVTDVDDDLLIKAKSLNKTWKSLGQTQTMLHLKNMDSLNALRPDHYPKATENIPQMIEIIKVLIKKGLGYVSGGNVYFEVGKDKNFGKLSKYGYKAMLEIANERGNFPTDRNKKDPLDFVLWQAQKEGEPFWESPWGRGRPGWHIECSAMSMRYLGPTVTIHGGGEDLLFPHHECEIAQSENYCGKQFVKIWMHSAMVFCDRKKMSKSLGNMVFVHDLVKKYSGNEIRAFLLLRFYRKSFNYRENQFEGVRKMVKLLEDRASGGKKISLAQLRGEAPRIVSAFEDDFNIPLVFKESIKIANSKQENAPQILSTVLDVLGFRI